MRAALYVRVSTEEQAQEGLSIDAQLKALQQYCRERQYLIVETFVDAGESARTDKRPGFQRMIAMAKQRPKPFDLILVHKMDRFARNREDSAVYKALLRKELGIDVISKTERFDDTPTGKPTEGITEVFAEFYSANLAHEVLKGT
jgi:site-specific DNA recombinase